MKGEGLVYKKIDSLLMKGAGLESWYDEGMVYTEEDEFKNFQLKLKIHPK